MSAKLEISPLKPLKSAFSLTFQCKGLASIPKAIMAFPVLGCPATKNSVCAYTDADKDKYDSCVDEGPVFSLDGGVSLGFAAAAAAALTAPAGGAGAVLVVKASVGFAANIDNWLGNLILNGQNTLQGCPFPPLGALTPLKMVKALWIKIKQALQKVVDAGAKLGDMLVRAIKYIWKVLVNALPDAPPSSFPSLGAGVAPVAASRRLGEQLSISTSGICLSPLDEMLIGLGMKMVDAIVALLKDVGEDVMDMIVSMWTALKELGTAIKDGAVAMYRAVVTNMERGINDLVVMVKQGASETKAVLLAIFQEFMDAKESIGQAIKKLFKWLKAAGKSTIQAIKDIKNDIIDEGKGQILDLFDAIKDEIGDACQAIKDLKAAGITQSSLANALANVGNLMCSAKCSKWTDIPFTDKKLCVGVDVDDELCTKWAEFPGFSRPSCSCASVKICGPKIPFVGTPCLPFKAPKLPCSCCAEKKKKSVLGFKIPYCAKLKTVDYGPWRYCKKFW